MRLIDADALKDDLTKWFPQFTLEGIEPKTLFAQIMRDIDNAPTVETPTIYEFKGCDNCELDRPKGKWVVEDWTKIIECNLCHGQAPICITSGEQYESNFCPICGADMRGEKE